MHEQKTPAIDGQETFVGTAAAESRIARLGKRPGAVARAGKIRVEMAEADRAYPGGSAAIRKRVAGAGDEGASRSAG